MIFATAACRIESEYGHTTIPIRQLEATRRYRRQRLKTDPAFIAAEPARFERLRAQGADRDGALVSGFRTWGRPSRLGDDKVKAFFESEEVGMRVSACVLGLLLAVVPLRSIAPEPADSWESAARELETMLEASMAMNEAMSDAFLKMEELAVHREGCILRLEGIVNRIFGIGESMIVGGAAMREISLPISQWFDEVDSLRWCDERDRKLSVEANEAKAALKIAGLKGLAATE